MTMTINLQTFKHIEVSTVEVCFNVPEPVCVSVGANIGASIQVLISAGLKGPMVGEKEGIGLFLAVNLVVSQCYT